MSEKPTNAERISAQLRLAMREAIDASGKSRETIAKELAVILDRPHITPTYLSRYIDEAPKPLIMNMIMFTAMVAVTRDMRLLQMMASEFGFIAIPDNQLHLVRASQMREKAAELLRMADDEAAAAKEPVSAPHIGKLI